MMPDRGRSIPKPVNEKTDFSDPFNASFCTLFSIGCNWSIPSAYLATWPTALKCTLSATLLLWWWTTVYDDVLEFSVQYSQVYVA